MRLHWQWEQNVYDMARQEVSFLNFFQPHLYSQGWLFFCLLTVLYSVIITMFRISMTNWKAVENPDSGSVLQAACAAIHMYHLNHLLIEQFGNHVIVSEN